MDIWTTLLRKINNYVKFSDIYKTFLNIPYMNEVKTRLNQFQTIS